MAYPAKTDRDAVLAAALDQVERDGLGSLAIRAVATKLGLAPNALYRYFENLTALEAAVAEEARRQMLDAMEGAIGRKGPAEAIRSLSEAYVRFALERPHLFALYLKTYSAEEHTQQCVMNKEFFQKQVARVYGEKRAGDASHVLWAFLHGSAVLLDSGFVTQERSLANLRLGLQLWMAGAP